MPQVNVGEIWRITDALLAIVVCAWDEDGNGEDIRIVPVSRAGDAHWVFTDRDVRVSGTLGGSSVELIAHAWLSQSMTSAMLLSRDGEVDRPHLERVRSAELIGLAPDAEDRDRDMRGPSIMGPDDSRLQAMRDLVEHVNESLTIAAKRRGAGILITRDQFRMITNWYTLPSRSSSRVIEYEFFDDCAFEAVIVEPSPTEESEGMGVLSRAA